MVMIMRRKGKKGDRCKKRRVQCNLQGRKGRRDKREIAEDGESNFFQKYKYKRQNTKCNLQSRKGRRGRREIAKEGESYFPPQLDKIEWVLGRI